MEQNDPRQTAARREAAKPLPAPPGEPPIDVALQATALATAANAIMITDAAGAILWVNPAFTRLTGYALREVLGQNPRLLKSGRQEAAFYRDFWQTLLRGQPWHGEFNNRRKDGTLYWDEHTITPVRDPSGQITHFVAVMQDITERKRAEAEVRRLNEQLEQRVRDRTAELEAANRELEAFCYSVSHDLRAPLRHINGFVRLLAQSAGPDLKDESHHYLEQVAEAADEMGRLIDDLLNLSRTSQAEMHRRRVALPPLVAEALRQLGPEMQGRNIRWKQAPLPEVDADPAMLRQVLINLLGNALKYTRPRDPAEIEIGAQEPCDAQEVIFIRDNGVGFDMQYASKLFGVFQRLHSDEEFEGTGVGLANVRRIIARHGGRTWAEGKPDAGATFYFSLPRLPSPRPASTTQDPSR